jgi:hypothetical protein
MSNTTPESPNPAEPADDDVDAAKANGTDADIANPPSEPVPARGHVNAPESAAASDSEPATAAPTAAPAAASAPAAAASTPEPVAEPEPAAAASDEDVAAAVARSSAADTADTGNVGEKTTATTTTTAGAVADENVERYDTAATEAYAATPAAEPTWAPEPPAVAGAAVAGSAAAGTAAGTAPYGQAVTPIYVTAPVPPKKKSNRGFGVLIALAGTVVFAIVYAAVVAVIAAIGYPASRFLDEFLKSFLGAWVFWVPVIFFFVAMVILIQILNRAGWWAYIIGGFVVAAVVYFSYAGGVLLQVQAWAHTPQEVGRLLNVVWLTAPAIWAGVVAREVSIWTGLWLAVRGRRLKAKNAEAQAEYDRAIAAGPRGVNGTQNGYAPGA